MGVESAKVRLGLPLNFELKVMYLLQPNHQYLCNRWTQIVSMHLKNEYSCKCSAVMEIFMPQWSALLLCAVLPFIGSTTWCCCHRQPSLLQCRCDYLEEGWICRRRCCRCLLLLWTTTGGTIAVDDNLVFSPSFFPLHVTHIVLYSLDFCDRRVDEVPLRSPCNCSILMMGYTELLT